MMTEAVRDVDDLIERLLARNDGRTGSHLYTNPDGPAAAAQLEAYRDRVVVLEAVAGEAVVAHRPWRTTGGAGPRPSDHDALQLAMAKLQSALDTPPQPARGDELREALEEAREAIRELRLADGHANRTGNETRFDRALSAICSHENRIIKALSRTQGNPE